MWGWAGGGLLGERGAGAKLVLSNVKIDPRPASRWPDAGGAVSV